MRKGDDGVWRMCWLVSRSRDQLRGERRLERGRRLVLGVDGSELLASSLVIAVERQERKTS